MKYLLILLALFTFTMVIAQETFTDSTITDTTAYRRLVFEAGVRIPVGHMADKVGASPEFGAWWRTRISHNDMVDLGASIWVPLQRSDFEYNFRGAVYTTQAVGVSGMVGVRLCKIYHVGGGRVPKSVEWVSSFGYAFFTYYDEARDQGESAPGRRTA
jgi:hypothetical protein